MTAARVPTFSWDGMLVMATVASGTNLAPAVVLAQAQMVSVHHAPLSECLKALAVIEGMIRGVRIVCCHWVKHGLEWEGRTKKTLLAYYSRGLIGVLTNYKGHIKETKRPSRPDCQFHQHTP